MKLLIWIIKELMIQISLKTLNLLPPSETKRLLVSQGMGMVTPGDTELGPQSRPLLSKESFWRWAGAYQALGDPCLIPGSLLPTPSPV